MYPKAVNLSTFRNANNSKESKPFVDRLATIDWERFYSPRLRFWFHFSMWSLYTLLTTINLIFYAHLPVQHATAFAFRSLICAAGVFYLFFYLLVPITLFKNRVILTLLSFISCMILWEVLNHYCLLFIADHFNVQAPYYTTGLKTNQELSIWYFLVPKVLISFIIPIFYTICPFFFAKILVSIIKFYSKSFKAEKRALKLQIEKLNLERDFLKAQLNPHFLFNTLNNLYGLSLREDEQTPVVITQLSEMMRYTLYESNAELVPLERELNYLENYVRLEKMRYKADASIVCEIDDSRVDGQLIAPLLTFTFVENAFKYGMKRRNEGFIKMFISVENNRFYFSIQNDKPLKQKTSEFGGIGLENARKRLELLYPGTHALAIEDKENAFSVELTINLN
ncbi:MAG TPA: histidine kinase [Hanamia sp.]|nr:histidine kinase [Hanamia sp.]